eukprot:1268916-Rhodomonas_salina.2
MLGSSYGQSVVLSRIVISRISENGDRDSYHFVPRERIGTILAVLLSTTVDFGTGLQLYRATGVPAKRVTFQTFFLFRYRSVRGQ